MLDAGAGEDRDAHRRILCSQQVERSLGRFRAQRLALCKEPGYRNVIRHDFAGKRVVHQGEVHRAERLRPHGGERVTKPMIQVFAVADRLRQPSERRHHGGVVKRRLACVLKRAASFHIDWHLAGEHQHRRAIGLGRGDRGRHVAGAGSADAERGAEGAAGARIAIGHVDRTALVRRDDRFELSLPRERRQERIDQAAGNQEQVPQAFGDERAEDVVGAEAGAGH